MNKLNDAQLENIHGGKDHPVDCPGCEKHPALASKPIGSGTLGGGGIDTDTLQQDRDLPGA